MDLKEFFRWARDFGMLPALFHHTELKACCGAPTLRATDNQSIHFLDFALQTLFMQGTASQHVRESPLHIALALTLLP